jgi:hypothetical protein
MVLGCVLRVSDKARGTDCPGEGHRILLRDRIKARRAETWHSLLNTRSSASPNI